ncbi:MULTISPECIES: arginine--tRNA ligase [Paenibacillus]|uniref:Arginine--tRNA ligase n=1 Tax=Paenibacillus macerans TaxID=44252 RepID=A0A090YJJ4_PAEMA|nr:arginine--tRNA ligase [Paenibacillus macerans]KFM98381.1 arginine--tRNA ligase [Paenibacillus macerans]MCY7562042.1 arginine--tRNA ligase [Paenibacillus macerans]MEC0152939.1 arginine--tRNA ligase [Paenibacillus macerans]SUA84630.1 protein ArgS [Paenibacillus macerans]GBK60430.1 arginine--tRNA ligase [Paenibacillus macerans]
MEKWRKMTACLVAQSLAGIAAEEIEAMLEYPPEEEMGDLSLPCFKLSKQLRKPPQEIALELKQKLECRLGEQSREQSGEQPKKQLEKQPDKQPAAPDAPNLLHTHADVSAISRLEASSGYLNFHWNKGIFAREVIGEIDAAGEKYGEQNIGQGRVIVIDYSSPNIAKPFHIGHLRSTVIGSALYRIFSCLGYRVIGVNHLGDWGTQFGKLIVAYRLWGDEERLASGAIDELLRLYVQFHDEAEQRPELADEARAWFAKMEQGDEEALRLWRKFVVLSMTEFEKVYRLLDVRFDYVTGESFYNDKTASVIRELRDKQLLEEDGGAWLVKLDAFAMSPALMLKQDGSTLYHTRDVAAALYRKQAYDFHKAVYVTDYSQSLHFKQWFKVVELMGYPWAADLVHVPFGRVDLGGVGLSTRKGNVVKLEELLEQAVMKAREIIGLKNPHLEQKDEVARQVGVGAVIFHDLSGSRIKDIHFSWEEALSFEGETGPYLQYAHVRACSLLRKMEQQDTRGDGRDGCGCAKTELLKHPAEYEVVKRLSQFPERIQLAADKMEPSIVSRYLLDLAQAFNRFYRECAVLVDDRELREARAALVKCVQITLYNGLRLLGLQAPERM